MNGYKTMPRPRADAKADVAICRAVLLATGWQETAKPNTFSSYFNRRLRLMEIAPHGQTSPPDLPQAEAE
jgi:hypothetical protein